MPALLSIIELNVFGVVKLLLVSVWGFVRVRTALLGAENVKFAFAVTLSALDDVLIS
jgi:hypothetical protein